jgi:hypothetical protein
VECKRLFGTSWHELGRILPTLNEALINKVAVSLLVDVSFTEYADGRRYVRRAERETTLQSSKECRNAVPDSELERKSKCNSRQRKAMF